MLPKWKGGGHNEADLLSSCYRENLVLATAHGIQSVAFPSVSTGVYGYPVELAAAVALRAVIGCVSQQPRRFQRVGFVLFDDSTYHAYASALDGLQPADNGHRTL